MRIGAIIIFYNPNFETIRQSIMSVINQVDEVCIIDNSSTDNNAFIPNSDKITYIPLLKNIGIAAAQNIGIKHFIDLHYDYIISCDQDSVIKEGVISELLSTFNAVKKQGIKIGGIAPIAFDKYLQQTMKYPGEKIRDINVSGHSLMEVKSLMNSMSLFPVKLFQEVGLMDESLFIDGVDNEICWRAKHLIGIRFFYDYNITMEHSLGLSAHKVGKHTIHITPPYRMYYQYRNYIWLSRRKYTPVNWILRNFLKYIIKIFYYGIKGPNRKAYFKNIFNGIKDGLSNPKRA